MHEREKQKGSLMRVIENFFQEQTNGPENRTKLLDELQKTNSTKEAIQVINKFMDATRFSQFLNYAKGKDPEVV